MRSLKTTACKFGLMAALPLTLMATTAEANSLLAATYTEDAYVEDVGASERVNYSGKLRMLSQRVVATGCNYVAGIDPDASGAAMEAAMDEFGVIVNALESGNPDLGINGAEERRKTRIRIAMLREKWLPVVLTLSTLEADTGHMPRVASLAKDSAPLLETAKLLVSDLSAQYSDPAEMIQSFAIMIDIAGRQRMLTQRMSKNVCLLSSDLNTEVASAELAKTADMFDVSLSALRNGMPEAGIATPPTDEIRDGLDVVIQNWSVLKPQVDAVLAGAVLDDAARASVFHGMNQMTGNMNTVVGLYSAASDFDY